MRKRALGAPKLKWTADEEQALRAGVGKCALQRFGTGKDPCMQ